MLKKIFLFSFVLSSSAFSAPAFISTDHIGQGIISQEVITAKNLMQNSSTVLMEVPAHQLPKISYLMHQEAKRCGGFMHHDSLEEAKEFLTPLMNLPQEEYSLTRKQDVLELVQYLDENEILSTIETLSSFHNRFYKTQSGVDSSNWIKQYWENLSAGRSDVSVDFFQHSNWPQPSVVLTIQGNRDPNKIVVLGGHADSTTMYGAGRTKAPGADDNASGIAVLTEVIRVMMEDGYSPEYTVQFMAYAAEEVGLLGSKDIVRTYANEAKVVIGAMQLDMTNFRGDRDFDITLISDFTHQEQNLFLAKIIDEYFQFSWQYSRCGYACSDHASWHAKGYPVSFPFEATFRSSNKKIHTEEDTLAQSQNRAYHALNFAKLALAFMVERAK